MFRNKEEIGFDQAAVTKNILSFMIKRKRLCDSPNVSDHLKRLASASKLLFLVVVK